MDADSQRVSNLNKGIDTRNCDSTENILKSLASSSITNNWEDASKCNFFIVAIPTPINETKEPDVTALINVCSEIGKILKPNDIVVFESTVYPGATEELCIPILEHYSGLALNKDFYVGYSPERVNVGDKYHHLASIPKIVSASTDIIMDDIAAIYDSVLDNGIIKAPS